MITLFDKLKLNPVVGEYQRYTNIPLEKVVTLTPAGVLVGDPSGLNIPKAHTQFWGTWQGILRAICAINWIGCPVSGKRYTMSLLGFELHHALLSKQDVRGMPPAVWVGIHHSYNVILLNSLVHQNTTRPQSVAILIAKYGEREVKEWYFNFPMKTRLPNIF